VPYSSRQKKNPLPLALLPANFALITERGKQPRQPVGHRTLFGQPAMRIELQPTINRFDGYFAPEAQRRIA